jgi:hypothetical protein
MSLPESRCAAAACPGPDTLEAFHLGKVDEASLVRLAAHVSTCSTCGPALDVLQRRVDETDSLLRHLRACLKKPSDVDESACADLEAAARAITVGAAYQARQQLFGKPISAGAHASPSVRARVRVEGEAISRLPHPNRVPICEFGEEDGLAFGLAFFSMELLAGSNLLALSPSPRSQRPSWYRT